MTEDYWGEDDKYSIDDWKYEVANDDTRKGYWEWVENCRLRDSVEIDEEEPDPDEAFWTRGDAEYDLAKDAALGL